MAFDLHHSPLPTASVHRESFILDAARGLAVLHLGCMDAPYTDERIAEGTWLHTKLTGVAARCVGVDINAESVQRIRATHGVSNVIEGDAEHLDQLDLGSFDCIVAGEIIEHLNNPGLFLASARTVLKPHGKLIITTTNAYCARRALRVAFGTESIHPDHTYYFSHATLAHLAIRFGYELQAAYSYRLPNKRPLLPYMVERMATLWSPNLGEGIVHVYTPN